MDRILMTTQTLSRNCETMKKIQESILFFLSDKLEHRNRDVNHNRRVSSLVFFSSTFASDDVFREVFISNFFKKNYKKKKERHISETKCN